MNKEERKQMTANYLDQERVMGVYQITNKITGRKYISSSNNMNGAWGREQFELEAGSHKNVQLQTDWKTHGKENFILEILEKIKTEEKVRYDYKDVLTNPIEGQSRMLMKQYKSEAAKLEKKWIEKLQNEGLNCYNEV